MEKVYIAKKIRTSIKKGNLDELKYLLELEDDMLNWITPFGSWLHIASARGQIDIVKYLISLGMDVNIKGGTFSTNALERASSKGFEDIVEYLINENIEIDVSEPDRNPLFAAIYGGYKDISKKLIDAGVDVKIQYTGDNMNKMDAYAFAIERGELEIAEFISSKLQRL